MTPKPETFKELVKRIEQARTRADYDKAYSLIEYSAQYPDNRPKISHSDEALLLNLLDRVKITEE
jgi:hypothetical protein